MTATNHALTGAAIGLIVSQPALAIPLALLSHFICDSLPHFGVAESKKSKLLKSDKFRNYLGIEAIMCLLLVAMLMIMRPQNWLLAAVCAFIAASPDLLSFNRYRKTRQGLKWRPNAYQRFAHGIQWFERPAGAVVEIAWFIAAVAVVAPFIR